MKKGVKSPDGKYSPCWYSRGQLVNGLEAITIYAKCILKDLPRELGNVENNTEIMTDYFEKDRARFYAGTPEFNALLPLTHKDILQTA
jgi:hypothetical protein